MAESLSLNSLTNCRMDRPTLSRHQTSLEGKTLDQRYHTLVPPCEIDVIICQMLPTFLGDKSIQNGHTFWPQFGFWLNH